MQQVTSDHGTEIYAAECTCTRKPQPVTAYERMYMLLQVAYSDVSPILNAALGCEVR